MLIRKKRADKYLQDFINFCKEKYKDNLIAIVIYGSYPWGYFNKEKSDYDVFVIFSDKTPKNKREIEKKFPKITLQYFCTSEELIDKVSRGHWSVYITLLKSARVLYATKEYKKFLKRLKKIDFIEQLIDTVSIEFKTGFEIKELKKKRGYVALKWALPLLRKRLQLLTYIKRKKAIWNLRKVVRLNKKVLGKDERGFILNLDKRVRKRENKFSPEDRKMTLKILKKLNEEILIKELTP